MIALRPDPDGLVLAVRVQPGARKNAVLGERAGALRIAVSAPPEKGKANAAAQSVLAEALGCRASQLALIAGETAREKKFLVSGIAPDDLRQRLDAIAGPR